MDNNHHQKTIDEQVQELKKICKERNMRLTPQRIEIFKEISQSKEHPDAETLFNKLKPRISDLSLDTVYRTLTTLEELNIIFRVDNQLQRARFDADKTPHQHFICTECNAVFDFIMPEQLKIPDEINELGIIKHLNVQLCGICKNCIQKNQKGGNNGT